LLACPYREPLSIVHYNGIRDRGNFNASLFATEGVASVGPTFAPVTAFACGPRHSPGQPDTAGWRRVLFWFSGGAFFRRPLMNIPFTTVLLSYGAVAFVSAMVRMPRPSSTADEQRVPMQSVCNHRRVGGYRPEPGASWARRAAGPIGWSLVDAMDLCRQHP